MHRLQVPASGATAQTATIDERPDWIIDIEQKMLADGRARPWETTFGKAVNQEQEVKEDLITVRDNCDVQHSSVSA